MQCPCNASIATVKACDTSTQWSCQTKPVFERWSKHVKIVSSRNGLEKICKTFAVSFPRHVATRFWMGSRSFVYTLKGPGMELQDSRSKRSGLKAVGLQHRITMLGLEWLSVPSCMQRMIYCYRRRKRPLHLCRRTFLSQIFGKVLDESS